MIEREFCVYCGAGIGEHRRDGEGTCIKCDPTIATRTKSFFIDPPTGWAYGFPTIVDEETLNDPKKLKEFVLSKGYPEKEWEWARQYIRVWRA